MGRQDETEHEGNGGRSWIGWLLLVGVGVLLASGVRKELPAMRRYWNMERM